MAATAKQFSIRVVGENVIPITNELCIVDGAFLFTHILPYRWLGYNTFVYNDDGSLKVPGFKHTIAKTEYANAMKRHLGSDGDVKFETLIKTFITSQLHMRSIPNTFTLVDKVTLPPDLVLPDQDDGTPSPREMWKIAILGWKFGMNITNRDGEDKMAFIHLRFLGKTTDGLPDYLVAISDSADTPFTIEAGKTLIGTVPEET